MTFTCSKKPPAVTADHGILAEESFVPLIPIIAIKDLDGPIDYDNGGNCGLTSGVVSNNLGPAFKAKSN